ncbi:aldose 1-epimerase family protein [Pseudarthrobacter sp. J1738]|uniref:aldose 1-epimerase family protein n=1 Tax=unclassified Pseudarthrobacter TaxID=2647000 RepID=UPI003D2C29A0
MGFGLTRYGIAMHEGNDPTESSTSSEAAHVRRFATGRQFELRRGEELAVIAELGASLRLYSKNGVQLTETYADDEIPPGASGVTLAPWANRVDGGVWLLNGKKQQLDITEVSRNNASHGLLRNAGYSLVEESEHSVTLEATVFPQHGYPFLVRHRVQYALAAEGGLEVQQTLINDTPDPAPVVLGSHPYLRLGDVDPSTVTLTVPGATRLVADERLIPRSSESVSGDFDLRAGKVVGELDIDVAITDLEFTNGRAVSTLADPAGRTVSLWQDETCQYVHIYVTNGFPGRTFAVAVEPMTGPANAFNSGEGLNWVAAGAQFSMTWGIQAQL